MTCLSLFLPLSLLPRVSFSRTRVLRAVSRFRERIAGEERDAEAPALAIDSLGYIRGFKSYLSPAHHQGVSPVANRSSTADKVLARFPLWSPAGG